MGDYHFSNMGKTKQNNVMKDLDATTKNIEKWWDENPFTLGLATNDYHKDDLVGRVSDEKMDLGYFNEIERKFRKHHGIHAQGDGMPLLSNLIDFNFIKGKDVLDIAVGTGLHSVIFAKAGANVTSIDLTKYAVNQTKKNFEVRSLNGRVLQMDAQNMKFDDSCFDFINAWGCLMHMPDTEKAVSETYRVLRPEGKILAYMYNKNSWPFWFNIILLRGVLLGGLVRYGGNVVKLTSRYSDGSHHKGNVLTKFYTAKKVKKIFMNAGYTSINVFPFEIENEPNHWPMRKFPVFKYLPKNVKFWMAKRWGYGLIVMAKK